MDRRRPHKGGDILLPKFFWNITDIMSGATIPQLPRSLCSLPQLDLPDLLYTFVSKYNPGLADWDHAFGQPEKKIVLTSGESVCGSCRRSLCRRSFVLEAIAATRKTSPELLRVGHPYNQKIAGLESFC